MRKISPPPGFTSLYQLRCPGPTRNTLLNITLDSYAVEGELVFFLRSFVFEHCKELSENEHVEVVTLCEQSAGYNSDVFLTFSH